MKNTFTTKITFIDVIMIFIILFIFQLIINLNSSISPYLIVFTYTFFLIHYIDDSYSLSNIKIIKRFQLAMFLHLILIILYMIFYVSDIWIKVVECQPIDIKIDHTANTDKLAKSIEKSTENLVEVSKNLADGGVKAAGNLGAVASAGYVLKKGLDFAAKQPTPQGKAVSAGIAIAASSTTYAINATANKLINTSASNRTTTTINSTTTTTTNTNSSTPNTTAQDQSNFTASSLNDYFDFNNWLNNFNIDTGTDAFYSFLVYKWILTSCILIFISILITNLIIKNIIINKGYNMVDKYIPSYKYKKINKAIITYFRFVEKGGQGLITINLILLSIFMTINWYFDYFLIYNYDKIIEYIINNK